MFGCVDVSSADYGFFSRLLHRVALGSPAVLRAMMQMEQNKWKGQAFDETAVAPVFICGLARSGSTLLLNRLVATGQFSTSTYRHMPFVLAPNLWGGASKGQQKQASETERAHGDGMTHSFDSEEAFEEVFWRAVAEKGSRDGALLPWNAKVSAEIRAEFRLFMTSVVRAGTATRYLSKNNNNVTRIPTLLAVAKTSRVVIPFRTPVAFCGSTLAQHRRFLAGHRDNPFDATYMAWLGHHEFGPYFKPFAAPGVDAPNEVDLAYLCRYWTCVYGELVKLNDPRVVFFDYDAFCDAPQERLDALGRALELGGDAPSPPDAVHTPRPYEAGNVSALALQEAQAVHEVLRARAVGSV